MADADIETAIFAAISKNETVQLKNLLAKLQLPSVDITDEKGMTPLQLAAYKGNKEVVRMLLDQVSAARRRI